MKKIIALLLCLVIVLSFPASTTATGVISAEPNGSKKEKTEVLSMRDTYSKTYLLPDGSYQHVAYAGPVHYRDNNGGYSEINNEITESVTKDGYKYTNTANSWNAFFAEKISGDDAVMITDGNHTISFSFLGQTGIGTATKTKNIITAENSAYYKKLATDNRSVIYRDVVANVDIAYTVQAGVLKEDIVLKSKNASNSFKFRLNTDGLTIGSKDKTIALFDSAGKEIFAFAPLYMEDANGKRSENVQLAYTSVKDGYEITISADAAFLNATDTVYPVIIDPSIIVSGSDVTFDTCVDQEYPTSNYYLSENLWTGGALGTNAMRTYIKFSLPTYIGSEQVTSAYLNIRKKQYEAPTVKAYRVTDNWASSGITWNNQPNYLSSSATDSIFHYSNEWYRINVTSMTKSWLSETYSNYGFVLKEPSETNSSHKTKFYSSDTSAPNQPELIINYGTPTNAITSGSIFAIKNTYSEKFISANQNSNFSQQQALSTTSGTELWRFERINSGIYTIESLGVRASGFGATGNMLTASADSAASTVGSLVLSPYSSTDTKQWWYIHATDHGYTISSYHYPNLLLSVSSSTSIPSLSSSPHFYYWSTCNQTYSDHFENGYANGSEPYVVNVIIDPSAITQYLTSSVYSCATAWNNIDSNISVKLYFPSHIGAYDPCDLTVSVIGKNTGNEYYGQLVPTPGNLNGDWTSARIEISLDSPYINSSSALLCDQQMNFLHELGHALKLAHPHQDNDSWHPVSIMNQGRPSFVGTNYVPCRPSGYDKYNLSQKW